MKKRNKYFLGKSSRRRKSTISRYLQLTVDRTMPCLPFDAGIPWAGGWRGAPMQNGIFKEGHSGCDGYKNLSYHQKKGSDGKGLAVDVVPYIRGIGFDYNAHGRFGMIAAMMLEAWEELKEEGVIPRELYLHWGGFWKNKTPSSLGWDLAHYEIRGYEQVIKLK
jgi:hypothetical protein